MWGSDRGGERETYDPQRQKRLKQTEREKEMKRLYQAGPEKETDATIKYRQFEMGLIDRA